MSNSKPNKKLLTQGNLFKVSQSKVSTWRRCRRAFYHAHVEQIMPKKKARPLKFGTIIHQMTEADINGKNPFKVLSTVAKTEAKLFDAEREMYGNIIEDIRYIMTAYFDYWDKKPDAVEYLPRGKQYSEHVFELELVDGILMKGKIDAAVKAKRRKWLMEHKSHKSFPAPEHRWRNLQSVIYIKVSQMMGWWDLEGTVWDYIRSKPPTRPHILQKGGLSRAALDSLPQVVRDVLKANKLNEADYGDILTTQTDNQASWFQRVFTPLNKEVFKQVTDDFISTAREMSELAEKSKERNFGRHCEWCGYRALCAAELQGHDVDFIKEREFVHNDYEIEEEVASE